MKPQQIDDILAWVQSHWSHEIYAIWYERDQQ
ncbi:MAG: cytochrome C, partial [gamma proteobacterium symbiont of Ctena orbiculata]